MTIARLPDERTHVEAPLLDQLRRMGWQHIEGDTFVPAFTERESFRDILLYDRLHGAIHRINTDPADKPWLDDSRINEAVSALERLGGGKLLESNARATEFLLRGIPVEGDPDLHAGRDQTIRYIDFEHPERNDFLVINQFRVDIPGTQNYIIPDIVLFVNGIPLVVIECKSPSSTDPMEAGITQLLRYSNQREGVHGNEGVERLFHYNQLMVSTFYYEARVGTVGASYEHYLEWKDTSPVPQSEVQEELGVEHLQSQHLLVAGMLRPATLVDIVRNFILFDQSGGRTLKMVARYQQYRAVQQAIERLQRGQERGGIIWHTQGSGKSLTMVFLVRKMRTLPDLRRFKVVVVTDRTDLERQLSATAALSGETVRRARRVDHLKELLREQGPGLVFAMIQKYQEREESDVVQLARPRAAISSLVSEPNIDNAETLQLDVSDAPFPVLNESPDILVLVDEAHRSQSSALHANLLRALPNCARIGFTGTPIVLGDRKRTEDIFGSFIDRYTIQQSEADGATVPILYEGRTADAVVEGGGTLDQRFEDMFRERTTEELEAIKRKYATIGNVLEAEKLIGAKAADMLRHYIATVLPNGFKAQVVATSRLAAIRYVHALQSANAHIVDELATLDPALLDLEEEDLSRHTPETQMLVRAKAHEETIRRLEFAAIISGSHNDPPEWAEWSNPTTQEARIAEFKKPLVHPDPARRGNVAIIVVKSMLLTGFDAPVEQVLYLDRHMQGHELLQAIARVNRTYHQKTHGLVVDYFGVGRHLQEALAAYTSEDIQGALISLEDEVPRLENRHRRLLNVFSSRDITRGSDVQGYVDACVDLLEDVKIRVDFVAKLKPFLQSLDTVLPRPQALPYVRDAKLFGFINKAAGNRYRDPQLSLLGAGQKVRQLIDEYVISQGIDPRVPPISILDPGYEQAVADQRSARAKASEMAHATRAYISESYSQDPAYYRRLSERLEAILRSFEDNWDEQVRALTELIDDTRRGRPNDDSGLDPVTHAPFLGILLEQWPEGVDSDRKRQLAQDTLALVDRIRSEIRAVDFWRNQYAQNRLHGQLVEYLDDRDVVPLERLEHTAAELVALARERHARLVA